MLSIDLKSRTALVTGGSGELGRVICRTLAAAGARVAIHTFRGVDRAEAVRTTIEASGGEACVVQGDIRQAGDVAAMGKDLAGRGWHPDIVVANAVVQFAWKPILEQDEADFRSQFESCVLQLVHLAQVFAPAMREVGWGRILAMNTECAMQCTPSQGAYASAKRGMDGIVRTLARELGPDGITVNQVAPGWTLSEHVTADPDDAGQQGYIARVPLRRRGTDADIAHAVAFLASDLAAFTTGAYFPVCGGNVMPAI